MNLDPRYIGAGLAALGVMAGAAGGYLRVTTPEAAQCEVDLAKATTKLELYVEVKDSCKAALEDCLSAKPESAHE